MDHTNFSYWPSPLSFSEELDVDEISGEREAGTQEDRELRRAEETGARIGQITSEYEGLEVQRAEKQKVKRHEDRE